MKLYIKRIIKFLIPLKYREEKLILWIRAANFFYNKNMKYCKLFCENIIYYRFGCEISGEAKIGEGLCIPHPIGIVIGTGAKIGKNTVIYQNVTIGRKCKEIGEYPEIGNNVVIYTNSVIVGNVKIADDIIIGANSVITKDITEKGTYIGCPAYKIN